MVKPGELDLIFDCNPEVCEECCRFSEAPLEKSCLSITVSLFPHKF